MSADNAATYSCEVEYSIPTESQLHTSRVATKVTLHGDGGGESELIGHEPVAPDLCFTMHPEAIRLG